VLQLKVTHDPFSSRSTARIAFVTFQQLRPPKSAAERCMLPAVRRFDYELGLVRTPLRRARAVSLRISGPELDQARAVANQVQRSPSRRANSIPQVPTAVASMAVPDADAPAVAVPFYRAAAPASADLGRPRGGARFVCTHYNQCRWAQIF
jgi:hypothetical protein